VLAVVLVVRLVQIDHNVLWDECYHLLAARSWVAEGSFDIAGGEYVRACVYTWLVSWFTRFADNDLVAGRIPALLSGSALAMLLFCWTSRQAGRAAGWAAALMLCFAGLAVFLSQLVRFYALHALCVLVASVAVFRLCEHARSRRDRAACAAVAVASLAFALLLQPITLIACVALGSYVALRLAPHLPPLLARRPRASAGVAVAALAAAAVLVASGALGPLLASAWGRYEAAPAWGEQHADDLLYYVHWLGEYYGLLWWLSPFAAVAALRRRPVFGLFCVLQFVVPLVLHSFSGSKAPRYLFYAMPFFFALWGVALAELVGRARATHPPWRSWAWRAWPRSWSSTSATSATASC
jgi:uncharacterized membrane protein